MYQSGITNVVSSSGTALTPDQIRLIKRLTSNIISGEVIFNLHVTFGFPFDLTADIARERDLLIDEKRFNVRRR